jgi:hypothetical protein
MTWLATTIILAAQNLYENIPTVSLAATMHIGTSVLEVYVDKKVQAQDFDERYIKRGGHPR